MPARLRSDAMTDDSTRPTRDPATCSCCGIDARQSDRERASDGGRTTDGNDPADAPSTDDPAGTPATDDARLLDGGNPLDATLPADLRALLGDLLGEDEFETIDAWVASVRRATGGGAIDVADLCHADGATGHWGERDGERYDFRCFYDAVAMAALDEEWVAVHTESPAGTAIEFGAGPDGELVDVPGGAVLSFGVREDVDPPADGDPAPEDLYGAMCPYVHAFSDEAAYREWAADVPATTVAMPLADAEGIAVALAE